MDRIQDGNAPLTWLDQLHVPEQAHRGLLHKQLQRHISHHHSCLLLQIPLAAAWRLVCHSGSCIRCLVSAAAPSTHFLQPLHDSDDRRRPGLAVVEPRAGRAEGRRVPVVRHTIQRAASQKRM
jgi:hypothetical protein